MMGLEGVGDFYTQLWEVIDVQMGKKIPILCKTHSEKNACFLFTVLEVFVKTCWSLGGRISLNA